MTRIAFLGLGAMGSRMATRLIEGGHELSVWNRSPSAAEPLAALGARVAPSPCVAAEGAEMVISMVRDDAASHSVWLDPENGALLAMEPRAIAVESSTVSIATVDRLARACLDRGIVLLDAPVAGSRPQAQAGQLVFLVGGPSEALERASTVFSMLGGSIRHAGESGHGMRVKLAVNAMLAAQAAMLAEIAGGFVRGGIDLKTGLDALAATAVASPAIQGMSASMQAGNFAPLFPVELAEKDLAYALSASAADGCQAPLAEALHAIFQRALQAGLGGEHLTTLFKLYR